MARKFVHGVTVRDRVTGFQGMVTGFSNYITGCDRFLVQPKSKQKSKIEEGYWVDEDRLELVKKEKPFFLKINKAKPGAGLEAPKK